jgi:hypothetical protein
MLGNQTPEDKTPVAKKATDAGNLDFIIPEGDCRLNTRQPHPGIRTELMTKWEIDMKHENPIEEIWRIRDELGAEEGYDVHKLFERLRCEEKKHGDRLVQNVERRAAEEFGAVLRDKPPAAD